MGMRSKWWITDEREDIAALMLRESEFFSI